MSQMRSEQKPKKKPAPKMPRNRFVSQSPSQEADRPKAAASSHLIRIPKAGTQDPSMDLEVSGTETIAAEQPSPSHASQIQPTITQWTVRGFR